MVDPHREAWERFGRPDVQRLSQEMAELVLAVTLDDLKAAGQSAAEHGANPFELVYLIGRAQVMLDRLGVGDLVHRYSIVTVPVAQVGELARQRKLPHLAAALADGMPHTAWRGGALRIVVVLPHGEVFAALPLDKAGVSHA